MGVWGLLSCARCLLARSVSSPARRGVTPSRLEELERASFAAGPGRCSSVQVQMTCWVVPSDMFPADSWVQTPPFSPVTGEGGSTREAVCFIIFMLESCLWCLLSSKLTPGKASVFCLSRQCPEACGSGCMCACALAQTGQLPGGPRPPHSTHRGWGPSCLHRGCWRGPDPGRRGGRSPCWATGGEVESFLGSRGPGARALGRREVLRAGSPTSGYLGFQRSFWKSSVSRS